MHQLISLFVFPQHLHQLIKMAAAKNTECTYIMIKPVCFYVRPVMLLCITAITLCRMASSVDLSVSSPSSGRSGCCTPTEKSFPVQPAHVPIFTPILLLQARSSSASSLRCVQVVPP